MADDDAVDALQCLGCSVVCLFLLAFSFEKGFVFLNVFPGEPA